MAVSWPRGVLGAGRACGIKPSGELDLGLIAADELASWAGTFTTNAAAAACVRWNRAALGRRMRAIVVNSGNANACTGTEGAAAVERTADAVAKEIGCAPHEVLVASTGPIGLPLPVDRIERALSPLVSELGSSTQPFARSILTTDTKEKIAESACDDALIVGVAKGAAMLAPNMATMLAFIVTDASVEPAELQSRLVHSVDRSFNRISVDGCESTNDSVLVIATGEAGSVHGDELQKALDEVCSSLAEQMIRDAEGGSKLVRIVVGGAETEEVASRLARSVAASDLWRAAVHGGDPNWGRIVAALGASEPNLELGATNVWIGSEAVFAHGEPVASPAAAGRAMAGSEFTVRCRVGDGPAEVEFLTCDLSEEYVTLNATGSS